MCWLQEEKTWRKLTTWFRTFFLRTFCGKGFKVGSAAETHINTSHTLHGKENLRGSEQRQLELTPGRTGSQSCGGKGMPEAEKGVDGTLIGLGRQDLVGGNIVMICGTSFYDAYK